MKKHHLITSRIISRILKTQYMDAHHQKNLKKMRLHAILSTMLEVIYYSSCFSLRNIIFFLWTTLQCVILLKIEQLRPGWLFIPSATEFKYTKAILYESWWGKYIMSILKWALKFKTMKLNRQKGYSIWFKFSHLWYIIKCWYLKHLELSVYHSNPRRWSNI